MESLEIVVDRLERACSDGTTPAAACVAVLGGQVVHRSAHGVTCLHPPGEALPVTHETWFDVASLTKVMATTAVTMSLYGEGALALEMPVACLVPEFSEVSSRGRDARNGSSEKSRVTISDLLAHRSGLPAWRPFFERAAADRVASRVFDKPEDRPVGTALKAAFERSRCIARKNVLAEPFEFPQRERAVYSDVGFMVLEIFLERAGGAALDLLFEKLVARPLGLGHTFFLDETRVHLGRPSPCAATRSAASRGGATLIGEVDDDNAFALAGVAGHAGLFSTATDVALFGEAIRRVHSGERIGALRPAVVREFLKKDETIPGSSRALGFDMPSGEPSAAGSLVDRGMTFGHLGFTGCSLWIDLSLGLTVALLTNRVHNGEDLWRIRRLRTELHDLVISHARGRA